jgi:hypothetical protein
MRNIWLSNLDGMLSKSNFQIKPSLSELNEFLINDSKNPFNTKTHIYQICRQALDL